MPVPRIPIAPDVVSILAATSGLAISRERAGELAPHLESVLEATGRLRDVDVTPYEPALIFMLPRRQDPDAG